jgi:uncharacterized protein (DUF58 family)
MQADEGPSWRPTDAFVRAGLGSLVLVLVAVLAGRPDVLVLASSLLLVAVASAVRRPGSVPQVQARLLHTSLREGEGTAVRTTFRDASDVEHAVVALAPHRWVAYDPPLGVRDLAVDVPKETLTLDVPLSSRRWGRRGVGDGLVAVTSGWGAFRRRLEPPHAMTLTTLPTPGPFDAKAPTPHPIGLVGTNPARRPGEGTEFASIRPFTPGDRLHRVQWRVSLRTGTLHVTSTVAEQDAGILLLLDTSAELGEPGGLDGADSTLDVTVRAAGAIAEHYLRRGDRVGLRLLGRSTGSVPVAAGTRHLRRLLESLARVVPGEGRGVDPARMHFGVSGGTVVLMLSPMLSDMAVTTTVMLARRGLTVVVVDPVAPDLVVGEGDPRVEVAWRLRLLERGLLLERVQSAGIPVVAWRGPGTLYDVLRRLGRQAALPRLVHR